MSSAPARPPRPVKPKPVKPWQRVDPGRYRSSDARFTLESDGAGRWFVADEAERDELGLARTTGPFATLATAKAAADDTRSRAAAVSPLAARLADAASRPRLVPAERTRATPPESASASASEPLPAAAPRTWLDDLADRDPEAARRAAGLFAALQREGMANAAAIVRRDVLGDTPAVAASLLARDLVAAVARLRDPAAADVVGAVAGVLAGSPMRAGLPGWELVERDGPDGRARPRRLAEDDLR